MTISASLMSHLPSTDGGRTTSLLPRCCARRSSLYTLWGIIFLFVRCAPARSRARARRLVAKCSWPGKRQQGTYTLLLGYCHTVHVLILNGRRSSITTTLLIVLLAPFRSWLGSERFVTHSTKALWHNVHEISPHALPAMCAAGSTTQIGGWLMTICQL